MIDDLPFLIHLSMGTPRKLDFSDLFVFLQTLLPLQFYFLEIHQHIYPNKNPFQMASKNQIDMFDKALGTDEIRKIFSRRFKANDLNSLFIKDVNKFRESARKYYLYD